MKFELEMRCNGVRMFGCETVLSEGLAARAKTPAFDVPVGDWIDVATEMLADAKEDIGCKSPRESPTCTLAFRLRSEPVKSDRFITFCEKAVYAAAIAGWLMVVVSMAID